jgi:hypothetical protein
MPRFVRRMRVSKAVEEEIAVAGGEGSEAIVWIQLRKEFPGLGGTIRTHEGVAAALRIEKDPAPLKGHQSFLRHMIVKKLDDYFYRSGDYVFSHVPRVFGSISKPGKEAYLYEWAFGSDGFPWYQQEGYDLINLREWNGFKGCFNEAGVDVGGDTADPNDGRVSQNIVHQYPYYTSPGAMCSLWKRIDFGYRSIPIDYGRLRDFLRKRRARLLRRLRCDRYEMVCLAVEYLKQPDAIDSYALGRLEQLIAEYRASSLRHFAFGFGPTAADVCRAAGAETLLPGA